MNTPALLESLRRPPGSAASEAGPHTEQLPAPLPAFAIEILGEPETALLSRVAQRLTWLGVTLQSLRLAEDRASKLARIEIVFRAEPDTAELLRTYLQKLFAVRSVRLCNAFCSGPSL